ncbi:MAG: hypothetical protein IJX17_04950 [Clostridia bacterium]|nr:hypothetical protein [Clostridia bacterium]
MVIIFVASSYGYNDDYVLKSLNKVVITNCATIENLRSTNVAVLTNVTFENPNKMKIKKWSKKF